MCITFLKVTNVGGLWSYRGHVIKHHFDKLEAFIKQKKELQKQDSEQNWNQQVV